MNKYSHWEIRFKTTDESSAQNIAEKLNHLIRQPRSMQKPQLNGLCTSFHPAKKDLSEFMAIYSDTTSHAFDKLEQDIKALSALYPIIFSVRGWYDDEPVIYMNAKAGASERNIPELVYPGFSEIIYE